VLRYFTVPAQSEVTTRFRCATARGIFTMAGLRAACGQAGGPLRQQEAARRIGPLQERGLHHGDTRP
jgi:hypothetical protein